MPRHLVLDTNVVLDLLHFGDAEVLPILAALQCLEAQCWTDAAGLDELARVVGYPEFGLDAAAGRLLLARYGELARVASVAPWPGRPLPRCKDPDDQKFLELAARVGAEMLVTKDKALLALARSQGLAFRILTPAAAGRELTSRPPPGR